MRLSKNRLALLTDDTSGDVTAYVTPPVPPEGRGEGPSRNAKIWMLRRCDGVSLAAIGRGLGISARRVSEIVTAMDIRIANGWVFKAALGPRAPSWYRRLRASGAIPTERFYSWDEWDEGSQKLVSPRLSPEPPP